MVARVVRLGSPRIKDEGTRIGTVRRPPQPERVNDEFFLPLIQQNVHHKFISDSQE